MGEPLQWRHNERDGVSNQRRLDYLLSRLFRRRSKKTSKLRVTGLCEGKSPMTGEFPAQKPVTRKMFPLHDVIMPIIITIETEQYKSQTRVHIVCVIRSGCSCNMKFLVFLHIYHISNNVCVFEFGWIPGDFIDDYSSLIEAIVWCYQVITWTRILWLVLIRKWYCSAVDNLISII